MSKSKKSDFVNALLRGIRVVQYLASEGFRPKTVLEIQRAVHISGATAWRMLKTLELLEWALYNPTAQTWELDRSLKAIATAYEQGVRARVAAVKSEYREVAGEELADA